MAQNISLQVYETYSPTPPDRLFQVLLVVTIAAFIGLGLYLQTIKMLPVMFDEKQIAAIKTQFLIKEKNKPRQIKKTIEKPVEKKEPVKKEEPVDLTKNPVLKQKEDFNPEDQPKIATTQAARPVFGLRRVFSTGLGASGTLSQAVIGKVGNTLNKDVDTITAKKEDLVGQLVSITTITNAPKIKSAIKPEYTKEMIQNKVEGIIKAKLLIDIDGKVKEVQMINDLGFGSKEVAEMAFKQLVFEPARRGAEVVAVWITFSYRFELQQ